MIDDRMILVGHIFSVEAFVSHGSEGARPLPRFQRARRVPPQPPCQPSASGCGRHGREYAVHRSATGDQRLMTRARGEVTPR